MKKSLIALLLSLSGCISIPTRFTVDTPGVAHFGDKLKTIDVTGGTQRIEDGRLIERLANEGRTRVRHLEITGVKGAFTVTAKVNQNGQTITLADAAYYSAELPRDPRPKAPDKRKYVFKPKDYTKAVVTYKERLRGWQDRQRVRSLAKRFDLSTLDPSTDATITITVTLLQLASDRHWHIRLSLIGTDAEKKEHTLQQIEGSDHSHPTISPGDMLPSVQMRVLASPLRTAKIEPALRTASRPVN